MSPDEISRLRTRLEDVERQLATVVGAVSDLARIADDVTTLSRQLAAGPDRRAALPSWFEVDADQAVVLLQDLTSWVTGVLVRHDAAREALPECWMLHGEAVEVLLALKATWVAAYRAPDATAALAADWHDRRLPGVMDRLKRYPGRTCTLEDHNGTATGYRLREEHHPHERIRPAGDAAVASYARWWATTRGLGPQPPPALP